MSEVENYCAVFRDDTQHRLVDFMSSIIAKTKYRSLMQYGLESITFALVWDDVLQNFDVDFQIDSRNSTIIWTDNERDLKAFKSLNKTKREELLSNMSVFVLEFLPLLVSIFDSNEEIVVPMPIECKILNYIRQNYINKSGVISHREIAIAVVESGEFPDMCMFDVEKIMRENTIF